MSWRLAWGAQYPDADAFDSMAVRAETLVRPIMRGLKTTRSTGCIRRRSITPHRRRTFGDVSAE
jgi:hypothetical protein